MKTGTKLSIAAAALSGLLIGTAARAATNSTPAAPAPASQDKAMKKATLDAGQKAVKLDDTTKGKHDCKGKNDCKGQGGCKTGDGGCKGKNTCKGKGGCKTNDASKM